MQHASATDPNWTGLEHTAVKYNNLLNFWTVLSLCKNLSVMWPHGPLSAAASMCRKHCYKNRGNSAKYNVMCFVCVGMFLVILYDLHLIRKNSKDTKPRGTLLIINPLRHKTLCSTSAATNQKIAYSYYRIILIFFFKEIRIYRSV